MCGESAKIPGRTIQFVVNPTSLEYKFGCSTRGKAKKFHRPWTGPKHAFMGLSESNYYNISKHHHRSEY